MLLFGHVGITAAVVRIADVTFPVEQVSSAGFRGWAVTLVNHFRSANGWLDYRLVFIGSLLPDIIDKPLFLLFHNSYFDGRGFTHSLLFTLVLFGLGWLLKRYWLLLLSFGSLMHLLLDEIWYQPVTVFWPFLGWFPPRDSTGWLSDIWDGLLRPQVFIPEIIGLTVCCYLLYRILRGKGLTAFLRRGLIR